MALKKDFIKTEPQFNGELKLVDAYWRVERVSGTKKNAQATVSVSNVVGDNLIQVAVKEYSFTPSMNSKNFIAQAYEHLKTLPEFEGATDC
jgi:hypothetical protein